MDEFCNGTFWSVSLTWNGTWPQFTECFQNTVLIWIASGWLWITSPIYLWYLCSYKGESLPWSWKSILKTIIIIPLFVVCLIEISSTIWKDEGAYWRADLVGPSIEALTLILVMIYIQLERKKGFVTSGVLFIYWSLCLITYIIPFYSKIIKKVYDSDTPNFVVFYVYFAFTVIEFLLFCVADNPPRVLTDKTPCPIIRSSFLSRISFWWTNRLVLEGYKRPLTEEDMFTLLPCDQSAQVVPRFDKNWRKEALKKQRTQRAKGQTPSKIVYVQPSTSQIQEEDDSESTPLLKKSKDSKKDSKKDSESKKTEIDLSHKPSLTKVLFKTFGWELLHAQVFKLLYDILQFVNPLLLQQLIAFTDTDPNDTSAEWYQEWKGFVLAAAFFVVVLLQSFFFHQLFFYGQSVGLRVRASIISAVIRKALSMDNQARKESTVGEIVNLMSVDAEHIQDILAYIWALWSSPLQIIIALYFLYQTLGPSMFAGFAIMVLMIPVNGVLFSMAQKFQKDQMSQKDNRIRLLTEILNGIKILKLYAWELAFKEKVSDIRNTELKILRKMALIGVTMMFSWTVLPYLVSLATFGTYIAVSKDHLLQASTAFVAISLFNILRFAINLTPFIISQAVMANVSLNRLNRFLNHSDLDLGSVTKDMNESGAVVISSGKFMWDPEIGPCLQDINLTIPEGKLVAVVGQVGMGKSSLISAILGEVIKIEGKVNVKGSVAYVPQQAWIQNAKLKDNILFGKHFNAGTYDKVVDACALTHDLEILPGGDMTEIGEKGINLSGGQKQRVSLARSVYFDADIYLLDDPLSAVDSHVGKHIFDHVIGSNGLLKGKTRILVTHGVHWLERVDMIVVIDNGRISEMGSYDELLDHAGPFAKFLQTYLTQADESEDEDDPEVSQVKAHILQRLTSITSEDLSDKELSKMSDAEEGLRKRISKTSESDDGSKARRLSRMLSKEEKREEKDTKPIKADDKLIEEEKLEVGRVKWEVIMSYARSIGWFFSLLIFLLYALYEGSQVFSNVWLSLWTGDSLLTNYSIPTNDSRLREKTDFYLGIYGGLGGLQVFFVLGFSIITVLRMIHASKILHYNMLHNILRSPMSFFDTTPVGRIVNRFSQDIDTIDTQLPNTFQMWIDCALLVVGTLIVISYSTPIFIAVILPLGILYFVIQRFYIPTSRQLKRLESKTRSPIYNHFSETLTGATVIRAYGVQQRFITESEEKVDTNQQFAFANFCSNRWLGFRLELVGNFVILTAAIFAVLGRGSIAGAVVGLSISYALQITDNLNWFVRMTSDLETQVVAVERVKEYTETPQEAKLVYQSHRPQLNWPQNGVVEFKNYSTRYRDGLDLVLDGIDARIEAGEKVGIVGRTGAGKSSLTLALFRLIEPATGSIIIDGENICHMGLHDSRSRLTILPQDPVLFSGTLRMNLDPLDEQTDANIWRALEHAHLKTYVNSLPTKLEYEVGEGGQNLSVGQRQLVCLARSLLRKTKILILDEATAAVDMETDDLIQQTIRTEFKDCTVLTIAHRLNTVMDYDRIMVLDKGKIKEFDKPDNLLQKTDSLFYKLAKDANLV